MFDDIEHIRHIILFYFRKGKNATQTQKKICAVYGEDAVTDRTCQKWFSKFKAGDFSVQDSDRTGRPSTVNDEHIVALIQKRQCRTTREISDMLKISQASVVTHLAKLGYISRYDTLVPHKLTEKNINDRISVCNLLLKRNEENPFLKRLITGDEKWIVYQNIKRKRSWVKPKDSPIRQPKAGLHPKKVMLSVWWDWKGIIYYELLPSNKTINAVEYGRQLDELKAAVDKKRPEIANRKGVVFHHDNARPHVALSVLQKISEFGWDLLSHPAYSPDIAPSDYHLFRSLQNSLDGKEFKSLEDIENHLEKYFSQQPTEFFTDGIMKLPNRWRQIVDHNGVYIV